MNAVEKQDDGFVVDAGIVAEAFGIPASKVRTLMREGAITTISETGQGEDEGRWRLTFRYGARALRLTVDETGAILARSTYPVAPRDTADPA
ncbi:DUF6522 family protein [Pukyongiella litopenaei]|uniref:Uncharacterized protein n=1 Tax=Pukyongiella litopenaei TaxID=2605946 RepID=A0A2S0MUG3_9RHOB|nr:DUF6522 family protein [Pukyongiella litopenaei]AVO39502.1 hypothetical protein C6Y53_18580 [Pukyongiella litopenaei]